MFPITPHFIPYPLVLSSPLVAYITSTQGEDYYIYPFWECPKLIKFFVVAQSKMAITKIKKKQKLWGTPQLINMGHTTFEVTQETQAWKL
jgi:hypothetical protein